uniref:Isoleucine--tRNA ligase n=1 Tax=Lygus hesperus TaxID=30085 RepID=A0A0A9Y3F6_LYGHE
MSHNLVVVVFIQLLALWLAADTAGQFQHYSHVGPYYSQIPSNVPRPDYQQQNYKWQTFPPPLSQIPTNQLLFEITMKLNKIDQTLAKLSDVYRAVKEINTVVKKSTTVYERTFKDTVQNMQYVVNRIQYVHEDLTVKLENGIVRAARALGSRVLCANNSKISGPRTGNELDIWGEDGL